LSKSAKVGIIHQPPVNRDVLKEGSRIPKAGIQNQLQPTEIMEHMLVTRMSLE
jgi:hypothetical protein